MDKISVVVSCPIDTYSGYGARSRDIVKSLLKLEKYNVKVLSQRWGNTSFGFLEDHNENELSSTIINKLNEQPDVWIQITVPNEFQRVGKYNIGITAGIETNLAAGPWIEGCNRMDLILTSSIHSKNVLLSTSFQKQDNNGTIIGDLKLQKPVEVLFEGLDVEKYLKVKSTFNLSDIEEEFCFLFVGHWLQGDFGQDRKNVGYMIKSFLETFKNKQKQPALILKTGMGPSSYMTQEEILIKIDSIRKTVKGKLPNIYYIDGDLTDEQVNSLYNHNKVKAMVSLTKGEGFGRPLAEFSLVGKPIIASGWSGHIDFLDKELSILVGGTLTKIHSSAVQKDILIPESMWFTPDDIEVGKAFREVYKSYNKFLAPAKKLAHRNKLNFSLDEMTLLLGTILDNNLPEFPKQIELKLPTLQLPKLKKNE